MKSRKLSVFLALFLTFCRFGSAIAQANEAVVSLELDGVPLPAVLEQLAAKHGTLFVVEPSLATRTGTNVNLREVPLSRAIPIIAAAYGACATDIGRVTKVTSCSQ